jgi:aryl-phospho-beta-D-glucosidase BglC (GH1 family)
MVKLSNLTKGFLLHMFDYLFTNNATYSSETELTPELLKQLETINGVVKPLPAEAVYSFLWDLGRQGKLEGTFTLTDELYKEILGQEVYFGEVLGKHSEVYGTLTEEDFTLVTRNPTSVAFTKANPSGFNPLDYMEEE